MIRLQLINYHFYEINDCLALIGLIIINIKYHKNMRSNNILSLFVGEQSQQLAYHFYHLQVLFDELRQNNYLINKKDHLK